jgi:phosphoserine phosphatase
MIAARRSLLRRFKFETDYGVDIGLLLDASAAGARIAEVDIGHIEHDSHPLEVLGDMAMQVVRTMLDRAARYHRMEISHIQEVQEVERQMQAETALVLAKIGKVERLALVDMDGVLLNGRFILALAQRCNRAADLAEFLDNPDINPDDRTRKIAELFSGVAKDVFEQAARDVPLMPDAAQTVVAMRRAGYRVGIVTDSYRIAAEIVRRRVFADFSIAHLMKFRHGKATGQIMLSPAMRHPDGCPHHEHCKLNVMLHLIGKMGLSTEHVLAVGNGANDICLLRRAGLSVAFQPESDSVRAAARYCVEQHMSDLRALLDRWTPVANPEITARRIPASERDVAPLRQMLSQSLLLAPRID